RLLVTTGFLGGLTTFSAFSAEVVTLLLRKEWLWGSIAIGGHALGSLAMTVIGVLAVRALYAWGSPACARGEGPSCSVARNRCVRLSARAPGSGRLHSLRSRSLAPPRRSPRVA